MTSPVAARAPMRRLKSVLLAVAGGLAVAAAGAAVASPQGDVPTDVVHYTQASLATDSGARAVYQRIAHAAARVCENQHVGDSRLPSHAEMQCREHAIEGAVEKIHNPRLAAVAHVGSKSG
jgi:UrcA family protein